MKIRVILKDDIVLTATLNDNQTSREFMTLLPLELKLEDYNGTEKVSDLPRRLSTGNAPARYRPEEGDITYYAPWGNLAIFYKDFSSAAGLVFLGTFDGPVTELVRTDTVQVRIEHGDSDTNIPE